jgi:hypothetical protein
MSKPIKKADKYSYKGKDSYLKYFSDHVEENWDFESFVSFFNHEDKPRKTKESSLLSAYKSSIQKILKRKGISDELKTKAKQHVDKVSVDCIQNVFILTN